jgi:serine/threonine protein kinase
MKRDRLGRYDLIAKLASGGMATVFLAEVRGVGGFQRPVAIKICHEHLIDDPDFRIRFLDEARLAAQIRHPNVVSTLDVSDEDGLYLVMEYVEGGRVSDLVRAQNERGEPFPIAVAARIAIDALSGLHAAHTATASDGSALHVVHRDISPQNMLVATDGITRVVDFGIAKAEARAAITADNSVRGKAAYMAPEQVLQDEVTHRADVFSLAVVVWEILCGRRLFQRDSRVATMEAVLRSAIPPVASLRPDVPPQFSALLERALLRDPSARFASALELADAIEAAVPPASHRVAGALVSDLLATRIESQRALLRARRPLAVETVRAPEPDATNTGEAKRRSARLGFRRGFAVALALALAIGGGTWLGLSFTAEPRVAEHKTIEARIERAPEVEPPEVAPPAPEPEIEPPRRERTRRERPTGMSERMREGMGGEFRPGAI